MIPTTQGAWFVGNGLRVWCVALLAGFLVAGAVSVDARRAAGSSLIQQGNFRLIADIGDTLPNGSPGESLGAFYDPALGVGGHVVFVGRIGGSSSATDWGVFAWDPNSGLREVAREGQVAPGLGGPTFDRLDFFVSAARPDENGNAAFSADLSDGRFGTWSEVGGIHPVLLNGDLLPGSTTQSVSAGGYRFGASGHTMTQAAKDGIPDSQTILVEGAPGGSLEIVAERGMSAPGTAAQFGLMTDVFLNRNGQVAFNSATDDGLDGVYATTGTATNTLRRVAGEGDDAMTYLGDAVFTNFVSNTIGGEYVGFRGDGHSPSAGNGSGLWIESLAGGLENVAYTGQPAPGLGAGVSFDNPYEIHVNANGEAQIQAILSGAGVTSDNEVSSWVYDTNGALRMIAREGDAAPGAPAQREFSAFVTSRFNDNGHTALQAVLRSTLDGSIQEEGVWLERGPGDFQLVGLTGEIWEVRPGDFRQVRTIRLSNSSAWDADTGAVSWFNHRDEIVVRARFEDGSEAILLYTDIFPVPEPGTVGMLLLGGLLVLGRRKRRAG